MRRIAMAVAACLLMACAPESSNKAARHAARSTEAQASVRATDPLGNINRLRAGGRAALE